MNNNGIRTSFAHTNYQFSSSPKQQRLFFVYSFILLIILILCCAILISTFKYQSNPGGKVEVKSVEDKNRSNMKKTSQTKVIEFTKNELVRQPKSANTQPLALFYWPDLSSRNGNLIRSNNLKIKLISSPTRITNLEWIYNEVFSRLVRDNSLYPGLFLFSDNSKKVWEIPSGVTVFQIKIENPSLIKSILFEVSLNYLSVYSSNVKIDIFAGSEEDKMDLFGSSLLSINKKFTEYLKHELLIYPSLPSQLTKELKIRIQSGVKTPQKIFLHRISLFTPVTRNPSNLVYKFS